MAKSNGILLDETGDLQIKVRLEKGMIISGLFVGDVTQQNQRTLLLAEKGEIKEVPLMGVGTASYLDDDNPSYYLREVRTNLRMDGQTVKQCGFDKTGKLVIIGGYENS